MGLGFRVKHVPLDRADGGCVIQSSTLIPRRRCDIRLGRVWPEERRGCRIPSFTVSTGMGAVESKIRLL